MSLENWSYVAAIASALLATLPLGLWFADRRAKATLDRRENEARREQLQDFVFMIDNSRDLDALRNHYALKIDTLASQKRQSPARRPVRRQVAIATQPAQKPAEASLAKVWRWLLWIIRLFRWALVYAFPMLLALSPLLVAGVLDISTSDSPGEAASSVLAPLAAVLIGVFGLKFRFGENRSLAGFASFQVLAYAVFVLIRFGQNFLEFFEAVVKAWVA